ncbi:MAG: bifunctional methylenetetrahydrofolate dehydrogenase/methenyltetrahydrofolate cyclohydrolase FolD [Flavobacteriales bacterium]|nr:bifunctional methylenetetrahydrofolate dehydrogenase/methenyltetrahydrofolate cyclohydrolase FolD [Flavobacteriales bacterium]MDP4952182.1 bifunctional methylenetetrahydrofolate dehydrogenase/methenyltetrahydrofolate cyclohydrolase FolD [Flavobacteriales bacterium]
MILLDGKATSKAIKEEIALEVSARKDKGLKTPHLAAVLIGDDGASQTYVSSKVKACEKIGFTSTLIRKPANTSEEALLTIVEELNQDESIDGFIVQLPLPKHIDEQKVLLAIDPKKDVDGFHPENVGRMALGLPCYLPATPYGIMQLLERYNVPTEGKNCVVIGRSHIVGSPMSILLSQNSNPGNCTVTLTHSRTKDLESIVRNADILVVALGKAEFVKGEMVKEGAVVIDVGITRVPDASNDRGYRIAGDVDFESVAPKCSFITPVPGGVGPMTIASLLKNTLQAAGDKKN